MNKTAFWKQSVQGGSSVPEPGYYIQAAGGNVAGAAGVPFCEGDILPGSPGEHFYMLKKETLEPEALAAQLEPLVKELGRRLGRPTTTLAFEINRERHGYLLKATSNFIRECHNAEPTQTKAVVSEFCNERGFRKLYQLVLGPKGILQQP